MKPQRRRNRRIQQQTRSINITRRRTKQINNRIADLITLRRTLNGYNGLDLRAHLRVPLQFDVKKRGADPDGTYGVAADAFGGVVQSCTKYH